MAADSQSLARKKFKFFLRDRVRSTRGEIAGIAEQYSARGVLYSSMTQQAVADRLRAELEARALGIWEILESLIPQEGERSEELATQLKGIISEAFDGGIADVQEHYDWAAQFLSPNTMPPLDEMVVEAKEKTYAAIDEFVLVSPAPGPAVDSLGTGPSFIDGGRLEQLRTITPKQFDLTRLIELCEELNACYTNHAYMGVAALTRALIDHVPPIFGCNSFKEVEHRTFPRVHRSQAVSF